MPEPPIVLVVVALGETDADSPRAIGRVFDPELVEAALDRLKAARTREIAWLRGRDRLRVAGEPYEGSEDR